MGNIDTQMEHYIHLSKYSRFLDKEGRRETWDESVDRLMGFWEKELPELQPGILGELRSGIIGKAVVPSMRSLMAAGPALTRDNVAGFNCAGIAINHQRVFDEIFYLLMCGCGVGFSVERQYINRMPEIAEELHGSETTIKVRDSKIGWAKALKELIALLYNGDIPKYDLSLVRPAGARLKTFGGRASGPEPLAKLLDYTISLFTRAKGRKLNSLECHDLVCKIADTVIVGSVRRSACISLSNLTDDRMRGAKMGRWGDSNPQRALSNNSVAYTEKPTLESYLKEGNALYQSKAGERGMINKEALRAKAEGCGREHQGDYLLNPCGEAILRDTGGLCNLTEVIIRPDDDLESLSDKVRLATILGCLQATLVDFRYLRKVWKDNQEEERLLGVSLTGIMDHRIMSGHKDLVEWLQELKLVADSTAKEWCKKLGIPESKQVTLVKPSGTVSQLCSTSSGIHPRYAPYYSRRVTQDNKDPLTTLMIDEGMPHVERGEKTIFSFPIASPPKSVSGDSMDAMDQLELWLIYQTYWCDGNPSQTIYYTDDTFLDVMSWVWEHWDSIGGLSFFPKDDFIYDKEAQPYLGITKEEYKAQVKAFPKSIDWGKLSEYESDDNTGTEVTLACQGGSCEL